MDRIATKTKILAWAVVGNKEKINLDLCDFSPDQVAALDRLIRAEGENKVEVSLEPEQKKLQIAPIVSVVRLVSLACRTKGQKLTVADFKSPDERATAIKRMSAADTPVIVTIRELQKGMLDAKKKTVEDVDDFSLLDGETTKDTKEAHAENAGSAEKNRTAVEASDFDEPLPGEKLGIGPESGKLPAGLAWGDQECEVAPDGTIHSAESLPIKLSGIRNAEARLERALARDPKLGAAAKLRWYGGLCLKLGNYVLEELPTIKGQAFDTPADLLHHLDAKAALWFDGIPGDKAADRKRRELMRSQVRKFIAELIEKAKDGTSDAPKS